uniref:hypothetical protein n=1 Tax=Ningiella ruwaisensis TaxID=2364274 RepID=UPI00109FCE75|nr:hypothetical protein [Ningiella ruwaisensis]
MNSRKAERLLIALSILVMYIILSLIGGCTNTSFMMQGEVKGNQIYWENGEVTDHRRLSQDVYYRHCYISGDGTKCSAELFEVKPKAFTRSE